MQRQRPATLLTILPCCLLLCGAASAPRPLARTDVQAIIRKLDELYRSNSSFARVEMEIATPHWQRALDLQAWSSGMDKTFIRILAPKKERGVGTLRIGNEMWNFLPKTNKIIKVPPSMMMGSWMGSDFTNDDLVKEYTFAEDYTFQVIEPPDADATQLFVECRPKEGRPIVWERVVVVVHRSDLLPVRQEYYDEDGELVRLLNFSDVKTIGGRLLPTTMEMLPQKKPGNRTIVRYRELQFDAELDEDIFTLRHLRSPR